MRVNGTDEKLDPMTVMELLQNQGLDPAARGIAVAVNGAVVPRRDWPTARLDRADEIEIVKPYRGG